MFGFSAPRAEGLSEFRFGDAEVRIQSVSNVYFSQKETRIGVLGRDRVAATSPLNSHPPHT